MENLSLRYTNTKLKCFSKRPTNTFRNFLKIGCFLRLVPYQWNTQTKNLDVADGINLSLYKIQKNLHLYYTFFMWVRFLHRLFLREYSLVGAIWCLALSASCLSYITMSIYTKELLQFANLLLNKNLLQRSEVGRSKNKVKTYWHLYNKI